MRWLNVGLVLCLCIYGLSAVKVFIVNIRTISSHLNWTSWVNKGLIIIWHNKHFLLDRACLHHKCSCSKSYFLILALHKLEWEQQRNTNEAGGDKKRTLAPKHFNFEKPVRVWMVLPTTPLFLDCSHFSLNVARMHKLFSEKLAIQARHSG